MFCGNCGHKLAGKERFCPVCGTAVPTLDPVPPAAPVEPAPPVVPAPEIAPAVEKKGSSKTGKIIIAIIAAIALLTGGIFLGSKFFAPEDDFSTTDPGSSAAGPADDGGASDMPEAAPCMKYIRQLTCEETVYESDGATALTNYYYTDGNLLAKKEVLTTDGTVYELFEYTYDEEGNLYSACVSGDTYGSTKLEALFNPDGTISLFAEYYPDEYDNMYCDHIEYIYNADGLLDQKLYYYEGEFYERTCFIYDENGRIASEERFILDELDSYVLYSYDDLGQLYLKEYYNPSGTLTYYESYSYDPNGNMTVDYAQSVEYGWYVRTEYTYDEKGNCLSWIEHTDVQSSLLKKWTYDENGNMLDEKLYREDGTVSGGWYEWTYDEEGLVTEMYWNSDGHGHDVYTYYNYEYVEVPEDFEAAEPVDILQYDE